MLYRIRENKFIPVLFIFLIILVNVLISCNKPSDEIIDIIDIEEETNEEDSNGETANEDLSSYGLSMIIALNQLGYVLSGIGSCNDIKIVIPDTYNDLPVIEVGESAFKNNIVIESIYIPKSIVKINDFAFSGCFNLEIIEFEDNSDLFDIGDKAFYRCESLISIKIPDSVESLGNSSFSGCVALETIQFPNSISIIKEDAFFETLWLGLQEDGIVYAGKVAYSLKGIIQENYDLSIKEGTIGIASWAFTNIPEIKSIFIPDSIVFIGNNSFVGCNNLLSIEVGSNNLNFFAENNCLIDNSFVVRLGCVGAIIPDYALEISDNAFLNAQGIVQIQIPQSINTIGKSTFKNCSSLMYVELPPNLTCIPEEAFSGCVSLEEIIINEKILEINAAAFSNCNSLSTLRIDSFAVADGLDGYTSQGNILTLATTIYIKDNISKVGAYIVSHFIRQEISEFEGYIKYISNI